MTWELRRRAVAVSSSVAKAFVERSVTVAGSLTEAVTPAAPTVAGL